MAEAKIQSAVVLELSYEEAATLTQILACVGGPMDGERKNADAVSDALGKAGFRFRGRDQSGFPFEQKHSSLMFMG